MAVFLLSAYRSYRHATTHQTQYSKQPQYLSAERRCDLTQADDMAAPRLAERVRGRTEASAAEPHERSLPRRHCPGVVARRKGADASSGWACGPPFPRPPTPGIGGWESA